MFRCGWIGLLLFIAFGNLKADCAELFRLTLTEPQPHQVTQRTGIAPGAGFANVLVRGTLPMKKKDNLAWESRWTPVTEQSAALREPSWKSFAVVVDGMNWSGSVRIPAGGWYRLEVRLVENGEPVAAGSVEPFGVGEVFVVAGQSYATNCNDERFQVHDEDQRVVAFDSVKNSWQVAHDPQPAGDSSDGGSIWPPLGDALAKELRVPIAFANVAVGATSSMQWMPGDKLHARLTQVGQTLGRFRGVLWQQGESDVIAKTSTEKYVANLLAIRSSAAKSWNFEPPWLLAKSTHHPTVYNNPAGENLIRAGVDELVNHPGFRLGPDTDTLKGENRGDAKSRRHFSGIGQRRAAEMWLAAIRQQLLPDPNAEGSLRIGIATTDITPPVGFPMAGYYHERLAEGSLDPLQAKAIVFREGTNSAALVVCDLIGIATDLSREVRQRAATKTGIPAAHIVIAATHSHTAPDYMKELYLHLGNAPQDPNRKAYIARLIDGLVESIVDAHASAQPMSLEFGAATQSTPVSFNRRFVMRDGSVRTWQNFENRDVVRSAGPIDPEIAVLLLRHQDGSPRGIFSNFALHLDTVGGMKWSADYPHFIERTLQQQLGPNVVSIFGAGCCGDINHADPRRRERNKADFIGNSLGTSIQHQLDKLSPIERPKLFAKSQTVRLPLQEATKEQVARAVQILAAANRKEKVDFFEHVDAYKRLMLDQFQHREPHANAAEHITWGLTRSLAGIGDSLPVDVTVMTLGSDVAIVCLPGEVFVELGLAIKQASPFRTTLIIELSNAVETIYVPHRAAYAGGSYEVTNSAVQPGSGEMLVETALKLLRDAATTE